jgi:hypothetical protein
VPYLPDGVLRRVRTGCGCAFLNLFVAAGKAYSTSNPESCGLLIKEVQLEMHLCPFPEKRAKRSGTNRTTHPETDIVVAVARVVVVVARDGPRIVIVVDPRTAPQDVPANPTTPGSVAPPSYTNRQKISCA